jgi:hypothetical protein
VSQKKQRETVYIVSRCFFILGLARFGLARFGLARFGLARFGLARFGLARFGLARFGLRPCAPLRYGFAVRSYLRPLRASPQEA